MLPIQFLQNLKSSQQLFEMPLAVAVAFSRRRLFSLSSFSTWPFKSPPVFARQPSVQQLQISPRRPQFESRMFSTEQRGSLYNDDFRLFFKNAEGSYISPLHDIPIK